MRSNHSSATPRARSGLFWGLLAALVIVPLIEFVILGFSASRIGLGYTLLLLLASGMVGAWLSKREWTRSWRALQAALRSGRMPTREIADGILVLGGGITLMLPGFVSDVLGLLLLLPATRPPFRALLTRLLSERVPSAVLGHGGVQGSTADWGRGASTPSSTDPRDVVVDGEVIEVNPREIL